MSKLDELRVLRYGRSVDAPVNFRHRTGDSEGDGGTMLDLYAQERSVEEVVFEGEDEIAKARFLKGFSGYLRKVFSKTEREFLKRLMSGGEKLQDVGRGMGVDWFKYMQGIQKKAYKNTAPLLKLVELSGWSRAEDFTTLILRRLSLLEDGAELGEFIPERAKVREALKAAAADNAAQLAGEARARSTFYSHREEIKAIRKAYREAHREELKAYKKAYYEAHRKELEAKKKAYREAHREELNAKRRAYREAYREEVKAYQKAYREVNREELKAKKKAYREATREEMKAYQKAYREATREKMKAYQKAYREVNCEELNAKKRAKRAANRALRLATEGGEV